MKLRSSFNFRRMCLVAWLIACSSAAALGQLSSPQSEAPAFPDSITIGGTKIIGVPEDWSQHHVVFSDPGTEQQALDNGTYERWLKVVNDPRYLMQQLKRHAPVQGSAAADVARIEEINQGLNQGGAPATAARALPKVKVDWSMNLGSGAKVGSGMYPAKFSFNGGPQCGNASSPDFVVYNTSLPGSTTQASVVAYYDLYSSCSGQVPSVYWAFNTGGTVSTSAVFSGTGSQLAFIQQPSSGNAQLVLLKWAATPAGRNLTGSVTNGSKSFSISSGTLTNRDVGAAISGAGIPAGDTIASVSSSTAGMLFTAANGTHANELLAITADAGSPASNLSVVSNSSYPSCTAPCMTALSFSGASRTDAISSPFYDYGNDILYVGDASGGLHKFHPVFGGGTPTEVLTGGNPWVAVGTTALSSPVYDSPSGRVVVGDASGYLYAINAGSGAKTTSFQVATGSGIVDGPLVDPSAEQVYVFVASDMNGNNTGLSACQAAGVGGALACNGVIQFPATFTASTEYTESVIGVHTSNVIYMGAFDNLYWSSGTGNLYVNGSNGSQQPKLMRSPLNTSGFTTNSCQGGTMLPPNCSSEQCAINIDNPMTSAAAMPAPVTEIYNTGTSTDWIFTSVSAAGNLSPCSGACVYSWNVSSALGSGAAPSAGLATTGGTSGIIIDNTSPTAGASQVYFSTESNGTCSTSGTLSSGGCAVQASQSALN